MEKGFIRGKRAPFVCGKNQCWSFTEADIEACIRRRPWLTDIKKIQNEVGYRSYFRGIILEEYSRDPWYTAIETALMLGVTSHDPVLRYIKRGWLKADKRPANIDDEWIIRKSVIDAFLAADPREKRRHELQSLARHNTFLGRKYMIAEITVRTCTSLSSPNGQHKWDIVGRHGRCVWCGTEKEFDVFIDPMGRDKLKPADKAVIREGIKSKREAKEGKEKMIPTETVVKTDALSQLKTERLAIEKPEDKPLTTQPEFNSKPVEPVKKKIKARPNPCRICGAIILGRAMGQHMKQHKAGKVPSQGKLVNNAIEAATATPQSEVLAKAHWLWLEGLLKTIPGAHIEYELVGRVYQDAFIHGYKHGVENWGKE